VALVAGLAGGWAVSHFIFDTTFRVNWPSALAVISGGILATTLAGIAFAWFPLKTQPAPILRATE
jgi:putative ABC transport system permease protein